jgi:hypothetical protein
MDVIGRAPETEAGKYFRNNLWWWRPLWDYCLQIAPDLVADVEGHTNDGDGLDRDGALALARILRGQLAEGLVDVYASEFRAWKASLKRTACDLCNSTGVRTDPIGVQAGMPDKELEDSLAILVGRDRGWCNACNGEGTREHFSLAYHFERDNVEAFAAFLEGCGGFNIW